MKLKAISLIILLSTIAILGCMSTKDEIIYSNPDYPYFNITNVSTFRPDINHYTINVTITNNVPEKTIKYANGSIINIGKTCMQTVDISIYTWVYYQHSEGLYNQIKENVTLAYNETKVFTFNLGTLYPGDYTLVVSTPSMNTTYMAHMWDYGI